MILLFPHLYIGKFLLLDIFFLEIFKELSVLFSNILKITKLLIMSMHDLEFPMLAQGSPSPKCAYLKVK